MKEKQNELSRFVSYICDSDETVAEINLEDMRIRRYGVDKNEKIVVTEEDLPKLKQYDLPRSEVVFENKYDCLSKELDFAGLKELVEQGINLTFEAKAQEGKTVKWYTYLIQPVEKSPEHPLNFILYRSDIDSVKKDEEKQRIVLKDALTTAQSASAAKGAFLSKVSHEVRTPLNAIIGYLTMMKEAGGDQEKIDHYISNSELASKHLLSVINDVLDMSSIENGHLKIANDPFDVKTLLSTISSIYYAQAKNLGLDFTLVIKSLTYERFYGDSLRVNQVLMNLLSNSMKFTPKGGRISLTVIEKDGIDGTSSLTFKVADTGKGMSKEFLNRVFIPFEQESASTARQFGGTGLGLSITKNLVNLMDGSIEVQSEEGKGSEFTVVLPFKVAPSLTSAIEPREFSTLRALIVDDEENEGEYAATILKRLKIRADIINMTSALWIIRCQKKTGLR